MEIYNGYNSDYLNLLMSALNIISSIFLFACVVHSSLSLVIRVKWNMRNIYICMLPYTMLHYNCSIGLPNIIIEANFNTM